MEHLRAGSIMRAVKLKLGGNAPASECEQNNLKAPNKTKSIEKSRGYRALFRL
jgi:hypothetical protein